MRHTGQIASHQRLIDSGCEPCELTPHPHPHPHPPPTPRSSCDWPTASSIHSVNMATTSSNTTPTLLRQLAYRIVRIGMSNLDRYLRPCPSHSISVVFKSCPSLDAVAGTRTKTTIKLLDVGIFHKRITRRISHNTRLAEVDQ